MVPGRVCAASFESDDRAVVEDRVADDGVPRADFEFEGPDAGDAGVFLQDAGNMDPSGTSCGPSTRCGTCPDSPYGLLNRLLDEKESCWIGRVDALLLSRNAPSFRPLYTLGNGSQTALNANQLESVTAGGVRASFFRTDPGSCGSAWEGTYLYSGGFAAQRSLPYSPGGYNLAPPGIFGVGPAAFPDGVDTVTTRLVASLQSAEFNRRWALGSCTQLLAGFRWIHWQESLAIADSYTGGQAPNAGTDFYNTNCINDLYGGQFGLDTLLWQPARCFRLEGLLKAGAYYNNAVQSSALSQPATPYNQAVSVGQSPAVCSFAGEVGLTGVVPICCNWDFRIGYFGLWLTSIAQPANQLSGQTLESGQVASIGHPVGSLNTSGAVVLQGLTLGLEGRW